jgi:hypothetical protein
MILGPHGRRARQAAAVRRDMQDRLVVGAARQDPERGLRRGRVGVDAELGQIEHHVIEERNGQLGQPIGIAEIDQDLLAGDPLRL